MIRVCAVRRIAFPAFLRCTEPTPFHDRKVAQSAFFLFHGQSRHPARSAWCAASPTTSLFYPLTSDNYEAPPSRSVVSSRICHTADQVLYRIREKNLVEAGTIGGKTFSSKKSARDHFMDQREKVQVGGPVIEGELFVQLSDVVVNSNRLSDDV